MSLIVNTRMSDSRRNACSAGVERADPDERDAGRIERGQREPLVREPLERPADGAAERHPVDVAGRARLGRVEVAVRIDPDHAARLPGGSRETGERAERDRVVAAEHERAWLRSSRSPRRATRAGHTRRGSPAGTARARRRGRAPRAPARRRSPGPSPRARSRSVAPRAPRSGSPTGPCRRRAASGRGRAERR